MIQITICKDETRLEMYGTAEDLSAEMARAIKHASEKIIKGVPAEVRKDTAAVLATGFSLAVKQAYDNVKDGA